MRGLIKYVRDCVQYNNNANNNTKHHINDNLGDYYDNVIMKHPECVFVTTKDHHRIDLYGCVSSDSSHTPIIVQYGVFRVVPDSLDERIALSVKHVIANHTLSDCFDRKLLETEIIFEVEKRLNDPYVTIVEIGVHNKC
jgi:hypothetical protein